MKTVEVAAAVIMREGKILATQRGYGAFEGGWEFPGGKLEPGEDGAAAAVREIREELSAEIEVEGLITTVEYDYPDFHLTMHCYLCRLVDNHIELLEHHAAKWLDGSNIDSVDWLPADVDLVQTLKNQLLG